MYKGKRILAIIPARGGSKGLPDKNIKLLCGLPLIAHTIIQAQQSKLIDRLIVSTDSDRIKQTANRFMCDVIDRPEILAKDEAPVSETICQVIESLKYDVAEQYDIVMMLECTSPLRNDYDIDAAIIEFIDNYGWCDTLVAVGKLTSDTEHPFCVRYENEEGYIMPFVENAPPIYQRQQLNSAYSVFGGIYISKVYKYLQHKTFYQDRTYGYKVERWQKFEIDDEIDFICVEAVMKNRSDKVINGIMSY